MQEDAQYEVGRNREHNQWEFHKVARKVIATAADYGTAKQLVDALNEREGL